MVWVFLTVNFFHLGQEDELNAKDRVENRAGLDGECNFTLHFCFLSLIFSLPPPKNEICFT